MPNTLTPSRLPARAPVPLLVPLLVLATTLGTLLAVPTVGRAQERTSRTIQANKALVRDYVDHCLSGGDLDCLARYWDTGKAGGVRKSEELRRSYFPDLRYAVQSLLAEDDRVVAVLRVTGQHTGDGPPVHGDKEPIPPSGGTLDLNEVVIYTVSGGMIRQGELFSDRIPIAQALGYTVVPPGKH
jgi:predicted ester cyclase